MSWELIKPTEREVVRNNLLLLHGAGTSEPLQVQVAGLLRAIGGYAQRARVFEAPMFGVTVCKIQPVIVIVPGGRDRREILPDPAVGVGDEEAVIDAAVVFIQQHP